MKKNIFILFAMILSCLNGFSQTLTPSPASVTTGGTVTVTAAGESVFRNYKGSLSTNNLEFVTVPAGQNIYLKVDNITQTQVFNDLGSKPSIFTFKVTNSSPQSIQLTLPLTGVLQSTFTPFPEIVNPAYKQTITITVKPTATTPVPNEYKSVPFTRSCGPGLQGSVVYYTVPAGTFTAATLDAANALRDADIAAKGQNNANLHGTCLIVYTNPTAISGSFVRDNCGSNSTPGAPVPYTIAAGQISSTISAADAQSKAQIEFNTKGQANANIVGECNPEPYIDGPTSVYRGNRVRYSVKNFSAGDTFAWSISDPSAASIASGQSSTNPLVNILNTGGAQPFPFRVRLTVTKTSGVVKNVDLTVTSLYCTNCPIN